MINEDVMAGLSARRERNLDQSDLAAYNTAEVVWQAWAPIERLTALPVAAEELLDTASAALGHFTNAGAWQRTFAWECVEAAAWGRARPRPLPHWAAELQPGSRAPGSVVRAIAKLVQRRPKPHSDGLA